MEEQKATLQRFYDLDKESAFLWDIFDLDADTYGFKLWTNAHSCIYFPMDITYENSEKIARLVRDIYGQHREIMRTWDMSYEYMKSE